jgi:hypothetical protein
MGMYLNDVDAAWYVYRNIVYGTGSHGIFIDNGAAASAVLCNTVYYCGHVVNTKSGIHNDQAASLIENNACFANLYKDFADTVGAMDYNASSDTTGDDGQPGDNANSIANLTTTDQFVAATTTWAQTDLLLKSDADLVGEGTDLTSATYPEIEYPISSRTVAVTGAWDIGAAQYVASGTNYTQTVNESLGVTDSLGEIAAFARTVAEAAGITDSRATLLASIRVVADSQGVTDATVTTAGFGRALDDAEGITDAQAAVVAFARTIAEAEGVADVAAAVTAFTRTIAEAEGLADAVAGAAAFARIVTDAAGITDAVDRMAAYIRSLAEAEGVTDTATTAFSGTAFLAAWFTVINRRR